VGKERPRREAGPSPPSSAVSHERVELYLYSPYALYGLYRASVLVQGWTFTFTFYNWINFKPSNWNDWMLHADSLLIFLNVLFTISPSLVTQTLCLETILSFRKCHYMTIGKAQIQKLSLTSRTKYLVLCFRIE